jgi:hypothetical protein
MENNNTIELSDLNTSKASQQIKNYILNKQSTLSIDSLEVYKITLDETRKNFSKLSKVYRLLRVNNANQVIFYTQNLFYKKQ